ncbi:hypothetical protein DMENIID0001_007120 [Sergentomyia squamirostris]
MTNVSRDFYSSQFEILKREVEGFNETESQNPKSELLRKRAHLTRLEEKFQNSQLRVINETLLPEDKERESQRLLQFHEDSLRLDFAITEKLAFLPTSSSTMNSSGIGAIGEHVNNNSLANIITTMTNELKEQREQLIESQNQQRRDFINILENSRIDALTSDDLGRNTSSFTKLEPVKVPIFSGEVRGWRAFKDLFVSIIDTHPQLSRSVKMQYLVNALRGEAKQLIDHLEICDDNYLVAWSTIVRRFEDKSAIVRAYIEKFFDQPKMLHPSAPELRKIQSTTTSALHAMDAMGVVGRDPWLIQLTLNNLDPESQKEWADLHEESPTWAMFEEFLHRRCRTLEHVAASLTDGIRKSNENTNTHNKRKASSHLTLDKNNCIAKCDPPTNHKLYHCKKFLAMNVRKRLELIDQNSICPNCLSGSHDLSTCSYPCCRHCGLKHNALLHDHSNRASVHSVASPPPNITVDTPLSSSTPEEEIEEDLNDRNGESSTPSCSLNCTTKSQGVNPHVLFATAVVTVLDRDEVPYRCRVVLDPASQINIISSSLCQRLRLKLKRTHFTVDGVGDLAHVSTQETEAKIMYQDGDNSATLKVSCLVMKRVTAEQPNFHVDLSAINIPTGFQLADPGWHRRERIDILIGGAHCWGLLGADRCGLGDGLPILQGSAFGWLVVGPCFAETRPTKASCNFVANATSAATLSRIDTTLRKFFELEEIPKAELKCKEQNQVEDLFVDTTIRTPEGRYKVHLPFNEKIPDLDNNRENALKQLRSLWKKLNKDPSLMSAYTQVFREYKELGIVEVVPDEELNRPSFYLPHHCVQKESSSSTKVRVVFNASSKSKSGLSLNDCLKNGAVVQPPLISTLWGFRLHEVALTCDITKMYLQILLHEPHRDFQRFLWIEDGKIVELRFRTVCFGVASSAFLATRVINQIAEDDGGSHPLGAAALKGSFYVDDCLCSCPTAEEMLSTKGELVKLLSDAGMTLAKFRSNHPEILSSGEVDEEAYLCLDEEAKTLGINWNSKKDVFSFGLSSPLTESGVTKRYILSTLARIFDPCGFLCPITTVVKSILQKVWALDYDWDKVVSEEILVDWIKFVRDLPIIETLEIPRRISTLHDIIKREIHAFGDASMKAFGAVIYIVCEDRQGNRTSRMLTAKARINPVKSKEELTGLLTIPKAELTGALMATELASEVGRSLNIEEIHFWIDARVVLDQIYAPRGRREIFVKNRVDKILEMSVDKQWRHITSRENPADVLSRGTTAERLINDVLWWNGPTWLVEDESKWPPPYIPTGLSVSMALSNNDERNSPAQPMSTYDYLLQKMSSFFRMQRTLAWCMRWRKLVLLNKVRSTRSSSRLPEHLTQEELRNAEFMLVKWEQERYLQTVITAAKNGSIFTERSCKFVRNLRPFLDTHGVLRVGGRLDRSEESYDSKHPIILPKGPLSHIIAVTKHNSLWHCGPQLLLCHMRQRFWPLNGRNLVRKVYRQCTTCTRVRAEPASQIMGELPEPRVKYERPFLCTGVDLTGHIYIKTNDLLPAWDQGLIKAYVVIFVCMSVKAVHLELVTALSTEAFVAALRRFVARRGIPAHMYSDNGTNFVGADAELKTLWRQHEFQSRITEFLSTLNTEWHFIPKRAPHHGGLWEAAVRSFKFHFNRVIGSRALTYEDLNTTLVQIEAILNSRPLVPLKDHSGDPACLTPGHFLIGTSPTQAPDPDLAHLPTSHLNRWQRLQRIQQDFAYRWKREYLHTLQTRSKWNKEEKSLKVNDVVVLIDEMSAPTEWPLAIVVKVFPGSDDAVRVATVRTAKGEYTRPIVKLVKLVEAE